MNPTTRAILEQALTAAEASRAALVDRAAQLAIDQATVDAEIAAADARIAALSADLTEPVTP